MGLWPSHGLDLDCSLGLWAGVRIHAFKHTHTCTPLVREEDWASVWFGVAGIVAFRARTISGAAVWGGGVLTTSPDHGTSCLGTEAPPGAP